MVKIELQMVHRRKERGCPHVVQGVGGGGQGTCSAWGEAGLTCGSVPLESGWLARILPPQVPLLRGSPIKGGGQWVLGGGGRGGLQGVGGGGGC